MHDHSSHDYRHMLLMMLGCLIPLGVLAAIYLFGIPRSTALTTGLFLLCPLSHVAMMVMGRKQGHSGQSNGGVQ